MFYAHYKIHFVIYSEYILIISIYYFSWLIWCSYLFIRIGQLLTERLIVGLKDVWKPNGQVKMKRFHWDFYSNTLVYHLCRFHKHLHHRYYLYYIHLWFNIALGMVLIYRWVINTFLFLYIFSVLYTFDLFCDFPGIGWITYTAVKYITPLSQ